MGSEELEQPVHIIRIIVKMGRDTNRVPSNAHKNTMACQLNCKIRGYATRETNP